MSNRIFLVEDDISICDMVRDYLLSENFSTDVFHDGASAIRAVQEGLSLVLIDLMLPDMSGMEVVKAIRERNTVPMTYLFFGKKLAITALNA